MDKEKFNYQIVFSVDSETKIIFTGSTSYTIDKILSVCASRVVSDDAVIENVVYQPVNTIHNESKKES